MSETKPVHSITDDAIEIRFPDAKQGLFSRLMAKPGTRSFTELAPEDRDLLFSIGDLRAWGDKSKAALASELAGEIYGLEVLARHIEDHDTNTTRFLVMSRTPDLTRRADHMMTTFVFRVRNIPAALYKAMGGFATNGVNMTKLESYMVDGSFTATQFYADIEGHPEDANVKLALEELEYFTSFLRVLGTYPAASVRD